VEELVAAELAPIQPASLVDQGWVAPLFHHHEFLFLIVLS
jgi:hypothetical protein